MNTEDITGLVLCGGRGSRMGGVDKGLQNWYGAPLGLNALRRLGPQVGRVAINANRHLAAYESLGAPVWPDPPGSYGEFAGPLAGWLAGLERCQTNFMVTVPCDSPNFPHDLVARLAAGMEADDSDIAMAATLEAGRVQVQPVFSLIKAGLTDKLVAALQAGERKIDRWAAQQRCVSVMFEDVAAFANANTAQELAQLHQRP